jgi:hypothetical protein
VKLQEVYALGKNGHCAEALTGAKALGQPVDGLAFTQEGLEPTLNSVRTNYLLAETYNTCGEKAEATARFKQIANETEIPNLAWAAQAAKRLEGYDPAPWTERLAAGITEAEDISRRSNRKGWWICVAGVLRIVAGQREPGAAELRDVFLLPDTQMSYHLSRLALAESRF